MYVKKNNLTNLTRVRQASGISRKELAERSGVNERTIERYEQGRVSINEAAVSKVLAMAKVLNVPIEKIIEDAD